MARELHFIGSARDPIDMVDSPPTSVLLPTRRWTGAVVFQRDDVDARAYRDELRRTVGDDALLMEHLEVTTVRRLTSPLSAERSGRQSNTSFAGPRLSGATIRAPSRESVSASCWRSPVRCYSISTRRRGLSEFHFDVYEVLRVRRWTALLAYPAVFVFVPLVAYALARRTIVRGGRRYRRRSKFDVEIVE